MKTYSLTFVLFCLLSVPSFAQEATSTSNKTSLFKDVSSKLTDSEKNTIATLSNLEFNAQDQSWYKTTNTENTPLVVNVFVFDLTGDGVEEVGISYRPKSDVEKKNVSSMLFVKDKKGDYNLNIDVLGRFYFLNINKLAFPDVYIRNSAIGLPVYRWNGNKYSKHKPLTPGKLKRYTVADMAQATRLYRGTSVGE